MGWQGGRPDAVAGRIILRRPVRLARYCEWRAVVQPSRLPAAAAVAIRELIPQQLYGPGFWNWDIGVQKRFSITEHHSLQLRGDFLNAFNHFNLGKPERHHRGSSRRRSAQPNAGKILGGTGNPRVIQLGLKYMF